MPMERNGNKKVTEILMIYGLPEEERRRFFKNAEDGNTVVRTVEEVREAIAGGASTLVPDKNLSQVEQQTLVFEASLAGAIMRVIVV